ncbi:MAG: glycerophosphodiester phosphodiesterase [Alphaproteobacteria bacterium]|nr:glycerophosphodiester phosphodiesterase [Alphaproteobacteria bacterium]
MKNKMSVFKIIKSKVPIIIAHRGASADAPENTLAAFKLAKRMGVDGIEIDVHLSASGDIVVIHDYELNRTARMPDGKPLKSRLNVEDLTLAELRKYDFGIWFSDKYSGEKIPTLEEVMDLIGSDILLNIEIKADRKKPFRKLSTAIANFLCEYSKKHSVNNVIVSSFNPLALNAFRSKARKLNLVIPTGLLYGYSPEVPWYLKRGQGRFIHNPDFMLSYCAGLQNKGDLSSIGLFKKRPVFVWTVDDVASATCLIQKNITGIITNVPEKMLTLKTVGT